MCGIAGLIGTAPINPVERRALAAMNGTMVHRGPDSGGHFESETVALAMRRLAIVDLAGGAQPLFSEDSSIALVCNGEIYNHQDLRGELIRSGHRFSTTSDVETIIHAYEEDPDHFLVRVKGMFAFALWDEGRKRLLLGRDRLGEKPLYLWRDRGARGEPRLWFASELRSILTVIPPERRNLDATALHEFLTFQYVLDPHTPIEDLRMLPAGHVLDLGPDGVDAQPRRYWSIGALEPRDAANPTDRVIACFEEACRRMGSADVPVGVALSGGIDSSLVAAVTARHYPGQIHCFSVGYPGRPATDERGIAQRFASANRLPFSEVELSLGEIVDDFPELVGAMDTPIADIAAHGYFAVSRAARRAGIPVLLSGLGGDEMFWGYDWVRAAVVPKGTAVKARSLVDRLLGRNGPDPTESVDSIFSPHPELRAAEVLARRLLSHPAGEQHWLRATTTPAWAARDVAVSAALNDSWLISNCLELADRVSMAWSIEMRVPFLDIDLVEAVTAMRLAGLGDFAWPHKDLLLRAFGHVLPPEIRNRPKQGFTPPVQDWLRAIDARWGRQTALDGSAARLGLIDGAEVARLWPDLPLTFRHKLMVLDAWVNAALGRQSTAALEPITA